MKLAPSDAPAAGPVRSDSPSVGYLLMLFLATNWRS